jgi:hypothetical protein
MCPVWTVPGLRGTWARLLEGLEDPHSGRVRPIVFDQALTERRTDVVLAHLNHPLVQRCLRLLRAKVWQGGPGDELHRVSGRVVDDTILADPAVVVFGRLVVLGGDAQRIHEEILSAGGTLSEGRFRRFGTRRELDEVLSGSRPTDLREQLRARFAELWDSVRPGVEQSLQVRMEERTETLGSRLAARADREVADVEAVLGELEARIRDELDEPPQLELGLDEQRRLDRDLASLQARLEAIPAEIERESERVRTRYLDRTKDDNHLFPFAVVFIVPRSLVHGRDG